MQKQQVNVDKGEYSTVFQMFDKTNSGEISIKDVSNIIKELDEVQKSSALITPPQQPPPPASSAVSGVQPVQPKSSSGLPQSLGLQSSKQDKIVGATGAYMQGLSKGASAKDELNYGNHFPEKKGGAAKFPNGKSSLKFDDFLGIIKETYQDKELAEKHLLHTFSIFDRQKKGYINADDLQAIFEVLGEKHPEQEVKAMIKIAGVLSTDKITFKEFKDFFFKEDDL